MTFLQASLQGSFGWTRFEIIDRSYRVRIHTSVLMFSNYCIEIPKETLRKKVVSLKIGEVIPEIPFEEMTGRGIHCCNTNWSQVLINKKSTFWLVMDMIWGLINLEHMHQSFDNLFLSRVSSIEFKVYGIKKPKVGSNSSRVHLERINLVCMF